MFFERGGKSSEKLTKLGVKPVQADYTNKESLTLAFKSTGAKLAFLITDFFLSAKGKTELEITQGKLQVDVAKAAGVEFVIYSSAGDSEKMGTKVKHLVGKVVVEDYLKSSGLNFTILRPVAFFENFDDPANYNPFKKGHVKFLSAAPVKLCGTYDIGRAAAKIFRDQSTWNNKTLDVVSWKGTPVEFAEAVTKVTGVKTSFSLAMPICLRSLFLNDLHHMCLYFEHEGGFTSSIEEFKKLVPDALRAEDWIRRLGRYSNGEKFA